MAATKNLPVMRGIWTAITAGPRTDCLVTPTRRGFYRYATSQPAATVDFGHAVDQFENVNAVPVSGETFYFMCPQDDAVVVVTERDPA